MGIDKLEVRRMPDGKLWTVRNLDIETPDSWYYNNDPEMGKLYGRLYTWQAAIDAVKSLDGYHLPSRDEWQALADACGGESTAGGALKAKSGWKDYDGRSGNGTDDYGFAALPGGYRYYSGGSFGGVGCYGYWWTASENNSDYAYYRRTDYGNDYLSGNHGNEDSGFSVRCIGNE